MRDHIHMYKSLQEEQYAPKPNNQLPKQAFIVVLTELGTSHIHHYPLTNSCVLFSLFLQGDITPMISAT